MQCVSTKTAITHIAQYAIFLSTDSKQASRRERRAFFKKMELGRGDSEIVAYLAEVVQLQVVTAHAKSIGKDPGLYPMHCRHQLNKPLHFLLLYAVGD